MAAAASGPRERGGGRGPALQKCSHGDTTRTPCRVDCTVLIATRPSFFLFGGLTVIHCRRSSVGGETRPDKLLSNKMSLFFIYLFIPFPTLLHFCFPAAVAERRQDFCSLEKSGSSILTRVCRVDLLGYLLRRRSIVIRCGSVASAGTTSGGFIFPGCSSPGFPGSSHSTETRTLGLRATLNCP